MHYKGVQYRHSKIRNPFGPKHFGYGIPNCICKLEWQ